LGRKVILRLPLAALIFGAVFHVAYLSFLNPQFEYAGFLYSEPPVLDLCLAYALIAAPVAFYTPSPAPAAYGAAILFVLCYVPAQLVLLFTWQRSPSELVFLQVTLTVSMTILLRASAWGWAGVEEDTQAPQRLATILSSLTVISAIVVAITYRQYLQIVSFDQVYDLRFEASRSDKGVLINYLMSWLSYCLLPFHFAYGILRRKLPDIGLGLVVSVLLYTATGTKAGLLMGGIVYGIYLVFGTGQNFLLRLLGGLSIIVPAVGLLPVEVDTTLGWVQSILLVRTLAVGGGTMGTYYDYFSNNGYTYYTHIGIIRELTGAYPYGELSLGQVIGLYYSGSEEANFNANFWASDAFAAMGIAGVPVVTMAVCAVFYLINRSAEGYSAKFVVLWLSGFWMALLNLPLSVALLSGGGLLTMLMLKLNAKSEPERAEILETSNAAADSRLTTVADTSQPRERMNDGC
jgi:hypothetical protein